MTDERKPDDWFASPNPGGSQAAPGAIPPAPAGGGSQPPWSVPAAADRPAPAWAMQPAATPPRPAGRRRWAGAGLVAAGVVAGGVLAGTLGASAASSSTPTAATSYASSSYQGTGTSDVDSTTGPLGGSTPVRGDEKALSATLTTTLTQKAQAAVPGGTVYRVEADSGDAAYEAHMTKADGTRVTVKFDSNGTVTGVEDGMGK